MAEKGRRVVRFLDEPQIKLVWEGEKDEARMNALIPQIVPEWFETRSSGKWFADCDSRNEELRVLLSVAFSAGENNTSDGFVPRWREVFLRACEVEIASRGKELLRSWKDETLPKEGAKFVAGMGEYAAQSGFHFAGGNPKQLQLVPWWYEFASPDLRKEVDEAWTPFIQSAIVAADEGVRKNTAWHETEKKRQVDGVREGLKMAGFEDLATDDFVGEILKSWPTAGDSFPNLWFGTPELGAARWYRERRERQAETLLDGECEKFGVHYAEQWVEHHDPVRNPDPDGRAWYVDGGSTHHFVRDGWSEGAVTRIKTADKAIGYRADLNVLVAKELRRQMEALDAEELRKSPAWIQEDKLLLPENKEKLGQIRAEEARRAEEAKVEGLRQLGLREEEARLAAKNADEERRLRSILSVRKDWRTMLRWVSASRGYRSLYPDAQALLERIRSAQERARVLRPANEQRRADEGVRQQQAEKSGFLGKGVWGELDKLGLK